MEWNSLKSTEDSYSFWESYFSINTVILDWDREYKIKEILNPQNSIGRKQADKTTQLQMCAIFHEKGRTISFSRKAIGQNQVIREAFGTNEGIFNPTGFQNHHGLFDVSQDPSTLFEWKCLQWLSYASPWFYVGCISGGSFVSLVLYRSSY